MDRGMGGQWPDTGNLRQGAGVMRWNAAVSLQEINLADILKAEVPTHGVRRLGVRGSAPWRLHGGRSTWPPCKPGPRTSGSAAMLTIGGTTRVFLAVQPVDLRGSFNLLWDGDRRRLIL